MWIGHNDALISLAGLQNLSSVGEDLLIYNNDALPSLAGLQNLSSVGGYLSIGTNDALTSLAALENLSSVGEHLDISDNIALTSLMGLENLSSVGEDVSIGYNTALTSLEGLESLSSVVGELHIWSNDMLTSLEGLENISSVGECLLIENNDALTSLVGLQNLSSVGECLSVFKNDALTNLGGLQNLSSVGENFYIGYNDAMTSLLGLANLNSLGGDLYIVENHNLSICSIWPICQYLPAHDPSVQVVKIYNNASGCNSIEEIISKCTVFFSHVSGQMYGDLDCNNIFDGSDAYAPNVFVTKSNGMPLAATNSGGEYVALLAVGTTSTISVNAPLGYTAQPDTFRIVTNDTLTAYTGYDFILCPDSLFKDASLSVVAVNLPRSGFTNAYHVCYQNTGTLPTNATLALTFSDEAAAYLSIEDANGGIVIDSSIVWSLTDVPVFGQACFTVVISFLPTTPLGSLLTTKAIIFIESDDIADTFEDIQRMVGSYDPNDKSVSPTEIDVETAEGPQRLTYTVRFQNTGTFPATFVEVLDTLEANLDIKTLQLLSASHAYRLTVLDDHILKFRFDNINLPDSTSDEAGSHGYIMFSIETVSGLQLGNAVNNSAAIYFDYNVPVITNTATSTFVTSSPSGKYVLQLRVLPNPTHSTTTVFFEGGNSTKIQLINTLGSIVQQHEVSGSNSLTLDVSALPSGVYFIRVRRGTGMGVAKLVKE